MLNRVVPDFWAEISESLPDIESLFEDEEFPQRRLAALVASKVYYYLGARRARRPEPGTPAARPSLPLPLSPSLPLSLARARAPRV
jgi:hypothetical protein